MPTTLPGASVAQAQELLQAQDRVLKSFPEVERVFGKAGRADFDALAAVVAAQRLRTSASGTVSRFPASTAR